MDVPAAGILVVNQPRVLGHGSKYSVLKILLSLYPTFSTSITPPKGMHRLGRSTTKDSPQGIQGPSLLSKPRAKDGKILGQGRRSMDSHPVSLPRSSSSRRRYGYPWRNTSTPRTLNPTIPVSSIDSMGFLSSRPNQGGGEGYGCSIVLSRRRLGGVALPGEARWLV